MNRPFQNLQSTRAESGSSNPTAVTSVSERERKKKTDEDTASSLDSVRFTMILHLDMITVGQEGSTRRAVFKIKLTGDLAKASRIPTSFFRLQSVSADSCVVVQVDVLANPKVDGHGAPAVVAELEKQAKDPASILRSGSFTAKLLQVNEYVLVGQHSKHQVSKKEKGIAKNGKNPSKSSGSSGHTSASTPENMGLGSSLRQMSWPELPEISARPSQQCCGPGDSPDEMQGKITILQQQLTAKDDELNTAKLTLHDTVEDAVGALQHCIEANYTQLIWRQMQAHEQVVQDLLSRITEPEFAL